MAFLFGGQKSKAIAKTPSILKGLRGQVAVYGNVIPIIYGTNRVSGNLLDFVDFIAIPHNSQSGGGGKGFGGANQQSNTSISYTYSGAAIVALCEGQIASLLNLYETKGFARISNGSGGRTLSAGVTTYQATPVGSVFVQDIGVSKSTAYSYSVTDYGNPSGSVTLSGTTQTPMVRVGSSPASGQYTVSAGGLYTFNAADAAAGIVVTANWRYSPSSLPTGFTQLSLNGWVVFAGARGQAAWGYMTTQHPTRARGYNGIAYIASSAWNLGTQGSMQNLSFEVMSGFTFGGTAHDCDPSVIINDLLTNAYYGAGIPGGMIGSLTAFSQYCVANGILLSPVVDAQQSAAKWVQDILQACNTEVVWSQGVLKFIPYGDTSAVGNGVLFQPNTTPVYDLTDDDFIAAQGADPIQVTIPTITDADNAVSIEWLNRNNDYNPEVTEAKDDGQITLHGLRHANVRQLHGICDPNTAAKVADVLLKRSSYIRKTFSFKTDFRYCLLEPMDLVTLTDANLGLSKTPVRLTSVTESADGEIAFEAEEFPWGTASPTLYPKQAPGGLFNNTQSSPGNTNTPIIFEPPPRLFRFGGTPNAGNDNGEIWFGLSGADPNWGGCEVWWSLDGTNYARLMTVNAPSRMGLLTASFAAGSDPDTVNSLQVDLTESLGTLTAGTTGDADGGRTMCLLQSASNPATQEIVSFSAATLTAPNKYTMGTYLRRGLVNTSINAFVTNDNFLRLDDAVQGFAYDAKLIGSTISFKFLSFNTFGNQLQTLSQVSPVSLTVLGGWIAGQFVPGVNSLPNPGFELNTILTPLNTPLGLGPVSDHWFLKSDIQSQNSQWTAELTNINPRNGSNAFRAEPTLGVALPPFTTIDLALFTELFVVKPGDILTGSAWFGCDLGTAGIAPVGGGSANGFGFVFYSVNGTRLGSNGGSLNTVFGGAQTGLQAYQQVLSQPYKVPALVGGIVPAFVRMEIFLQASTGNTLTWTPSTTNRLLFYVDDVSLFASPMLGDSGSGGAAGIAPAPAAGDAAAGRVLTADGSWSVPAPSGVNNQTGAAYTIASGDAGKLVTHSNAGAIAVTLPLFAVRFFYYTKNRGAGNVTITPGGGAAIDGAATLVLTTGQRAIIVSDGTNYFTA